MSVLNREQFFERIKAMVGDDTSDDTLAVLEDFTDTYNDFEEKTGDDWKSKYEELDSSWKKRYRDRFFGSADGDGEDHITTPQDALTNQVEDVIEDGEPTTFEDLFEEREG